MGTQPTHPPKNQLVAFGQGKLADEDSTQIEQHLESCQECCETLLDLQEDTFTGLVRSARPLARLSSNEGIVSDGRDAMGDAVTLAPSAGSMEYAEIPAELVDHPRYRIVERIGSGGMGRVYRAEHRLMNRTVAIKLIHAHLVQDPQAVERFRREVQAAAKLSHPNIVAAYDAEQAGNAHFLVMEFVEGTDLATVVKQRGPLPVAEACECIRQAAEGLQHAYEKSMVHRDIKPHNLMMSRAGNNDSKEQSATSTVVRGKSCPQIRILDFGLAGFATAAFGHEQNNSAEPQPQRRTAHDAPLTNASTMAHSATATEQIAPLAAAAAHLTTMGSVMGTPDYMAPEQAADAHSADIRADIYSLGCTLYFLLTGQPPFAGDDILAKLMAHAEEPPPALAALRSDVPVELSDIVARMMAKNPADRLQTPIEVAAALAPYAAPPRRRLRRSVIIAILSAALLLAGVIYVVTDRGRIEIQSEVDDVEIVVKQGGNEIKTIDLVTGSKVSWLPSGKYEVVLREERNDVAIDRDGFTLSRWGREIIRVRRVAEKVGSEEAKRQVATTAALEWLALLDAGKYRESWESCADFAKAQVTPEQTAEVYATTRKPMGTATNRRFLSANLFPELPGLPPGESVVVQFETTFSNQGKQLEQLTMFWDKDQRWRVAAYHFNPAQQPENAETDEKKQAALAAAQQWLTLVDAGKYEEAWETSAQMNKDTITKQQMADAYRGLFEALGKLSSRDLQTNQYTTTLPNAPPGEYVVIRFSTKFMDNHVTETVVLMRQEDGQWRVSGYFHAP